MKRWTPKMCLWQKSSVFIFFPEIHGHAVYSYKWPSFMTYFRTQMKFIRSKSGEKDVHFRTGPRNESEKDDIVQFRVTKAMCEQLFLRITHNGFSRLQPPPSPSVRSVEPSEFLEIYLGKMTISSPSMYRGTWARMDAEIVIHVTNESIDPIHPFSDLFFWQSSLGCAVCRCRFIRWSCRLQKGVARAKRYMDWQPHI